MQTEMTPPRNAEFREVFSGLLAQMRRFHGTSDTVIVLPGSGSSGFEFTLVNTLSPGDKVLSVSCGSFGERYGSVAEMLGLDVVRVELEWGAAVTRDVLAKALDENPGVKAVLYTYSETSTGVANPVHDIGALVHDHGALLLVDAVSAAGGIPIEMDAWGIDMIFSGSQKAWMCPPGLVIVGVGQRAFEAHQQAKFPRFFLDLKIASERAKEGTTPTTPPMTMIYALKAAADLIDAEGLNNVYDRHARLGAFVRRGVAELGYRLVADEEYVSDTVTAIYPPDGIDATEVLARMKSEHGIDVGGGLGKLQGKAMRIGHMGYTHQADLERTLTALSEVTNQLRG
jgi:aspartate aminotransferase-like enzyme